MSFNNDYTRFPFFPLSYDKRRMAVPNEMMIDYIEGEIYIRSADNKKDILMASSKSITHITDYNNPHKVNKAQVGLGNVDNIKQASDIDFQNHIIANNPHGIYKSTIGLGDVENYALATVEDVVNGVPDKYITPYILHRAIDAFGINVGKLFKVVFEVTPIDGVVVEVFIDGNWESGFAHTLQVGSYDYKISKPGYSTIEGNLIVDNDIVLKIEMDAVKYAASFDIDPIDAKVEVLINGVWTEVENI